jgi:hypothetical protein
MVIYLYNLFTCRCSTGPEQCPLVSFDETKIELHIIETIKDKTE